MSYKSDKDSLEKKEKSINIDFSYIGNEDEISAKNSNLDSNNKLLFSDDIIIIPASELKELEVLEDQEEIKNEIVSGKYKKLIDSYLSKKYSDYEEGNFQIKHVEIKSMDSLGKNYKYLEQVKKKYGELKKAYNDNDNDKANDIGIIPELEKDYSDEIIGEGEEEEQKKEKVFEKKKSIIEDENSKDELEDEIDIPVSKKKPKNIENFIEQELSNEILLQNLLKDPKKKEQLENFLNDLQYIKKDIYGHDNDLNENINLDVGTDGITQEEYQKLSFKVKIGSNLKQCNVCQNSYQEFMIIQNDDLLMCWHCTWWLNQGNDVEQTVKEVYGLSKKDYLEVCLPNHNFEKCKKEFCMLCLNKDFNIYKKFDQKTKMEQEQKLDEESLRKILNDENNFEYEINITI